MGDWLWVIRWEMGSRPEVPGAGLANPVRPCRTTYIMEIPINQSYRGISICNLTLVGDLA